MKPPALRNFTPEVKNAAKPRPPTFYYAQPRFSPAPVSHFRIPDPLVGRSPLESIPQPNHGNIMLPYRQVNDPRKRHNTRGHSTHFDRSTMAARPPSGLPKGLGFDYAERTNKDNFDPKQKGLLVY